MLCRRSLLISYPKRHGMIFHTVSFHFLRFMFTANMPPSADDMIKNNTSEMLTCEKSARIAQKHDTTYTIRKYKIPFKLPNIKPRILFILAHINPPKNTEKFAINITAASDTFSGTDEKHKIHARTNIKITLVKTEITADTISVFAVFKLNISFKIKTPLNIMYYHYIQRSFVLFFRFFRFFCFFVGIFNFSFATVAFFYNSFNSTD